LGKSEAGLIRVRAIAEGDHASIEVYDDGRGLDPNALRTAAVSRAILTEEEANDLSDEAAYNLIFRSGLSTLESVTGTSGRGVGMDVVRANVETLKGDVSIQSKLGEFTRFTLSLPVNYAILQALLVDAGNQVSVIPLDFVVETLHLDRERIIRQGGRSRMPYRGGSLLLVELGPFLQFQTETRTDGKRLQVVVLSCRGEQLAVVVDRILRREEVVVKSVGTFLQGMSLVSGATILRMGDPAIILNVFDLIDLSRGREEEIRAPAQPRRAKKLLVVDDSVTSRSVQRGILERAGYSVDVARDGEEGLEMIRSSEYDLVVTDVDMPKRDGFQLTETLQGDPATRNLPVIIVTAKADDSERRRGLEAGARAYITKGAFDQEVLVDTVRRLIG
ncbi:MAG: response regulator, partial [Planctomycetota bacterium]|nr:response regulator [Planctomycetota bacterium]